MATIKSNCGVRAVYPFRLTRISYHVGSPWMLDGNTFFPVTGTPMRKMACMIRPLADAEPVPFAVAILNAKSLILFIEWVALSFQLSAVGESEDQLMADG